MMVVVWIVAAGRLVAGIDETIAKTEVVVAGIEELVTWTEDDTIPSPTHPTNTPFVVFIGTAKHPVPGAQTDMTYAPPLPAALQFPTLPEIHAIPPILHMDLKSSVAKSLLYDAASATLALNSAGEIVPVEDGAEYMAVGAMATVGRPVEMGDAPSGRPVSSAMMAVLVLLS